MRQMEKKINPKIDEFEKNRIHHLTIHFTTPPPFNYQLFNYSTNQLLLGRQRNGNGATRSVVVGCRHRSPHELNEFFHQGQADAGSAGGAGERIFHPVKIIKDFLQGLPGNTRSRIGHHDLDVAALLTGSGYGYPVQRHFCRISCCFQSG